VMILASLSMAGDTPGINMNTDRVPAAPPYDERPGQQSGGLDTRRP
jgi:hypothetical protein